MKTCIGKIVNRGNGPHPFDVITPDGTFFVENVSEAHGLDVAVVQYRPTDQFATIIPIANVQIALEFVKEHPRAFQNWMPM